MQEYTKHQKYHALKPIYMINILNFNPFKTQKFVANFGIMDKEDHYDLKDGDESIFNLFYVILSNESKSLVTEIWRNFFVTGDIPENAPDYFIKAKETVSYANLTPEEQEMITREQIRRSDAQAIIEYNYNSGFESGIESGIKQGYQSGIESGIKQGYQSGIEQGIEQGMEQGVLKVAKQMLKKGSSIEMIVDFTGINIEQINRLQEEMK